MFSFVFLPTCDVPTTTSIWTPTLLNSRHFFNISHKSTYSLPRHNRLWRMAPSCVQSGTAWPMLIAWAYGGCSQPDKEVRPDRRGGTGLGEVRIPRPPSRAGATEDAL
ncbi:hypothetical protein R5R35_000886 [Gryllus longicercus]|uniref:Uncharacterized protein n=1 Tax=Gryllus longicercus TaxID=2509291 RepID=A0AAN9VS96_9ORTH